jgi:hypothetical protein
VEIMSVQAFFSVEHFGGHIGQAIDMTQQHSHSFLAKFLAASADCAPVRLPHHRMMGDQTGPHKANQYFRVVPGVVARETSLRDTSPASEDIIAAVPLRQDHFARFLVHRLPVHDQALPINHSDTKIFRIVDMVIDPPFASPGRLGAGSIRFTPHQVLGQTSLENAPTPMKPFCGTRETLLKHARGNSVVNNAAAKDARRLT